MSATLFSTLFLRLLFLFVAINLRFCYGGSSNQTRSCIKIEKEALLEFKKHLKDPSNNLATWVSAAPDCCRWYGVRCDDSSGHVLSLHLRSLSVQEYIDNSGSIHDHASYKKSVLGGQVSSALLNLKHLRYLDLSSNEFGGTGIPTFIGSMESLRYLNLSCAGFGGKIPHQLGNLSNLEYLDLHKYGFQLDSYVYIFNPDFYPDFYPNYQFAENLQWISGLSSLKFLDLSGVNLSKALNWVDEVPNKLPSLKELHFSGCQLPPPQVQLNNVNNSSSSSLSTLDLSDNNFGLSLKILSWVSGLKALKSLTLAGNGFQGPIPRQLQNISSLRELNLDVNYFDSSIPYWLYGQTQLNVLSLADNDLSSFQPFPPLTPLNLSSLYVLIVSFNQIEGPIPTVLQNITSLQTLDLSSNQIRSSIPNWLYRFTQLKQLWLGGNALEGKISKAIRNMTSLVSLDVSYRTFLVSLDVSYNSKRELEGGINSFKNLYNLKELRLSGVDLKEDINLVFEALSSNSARLEWLDLSYCQLYGDFFSISHHLGRFRNLGTLYLSGNSISGSIPMSLGRLNSLTVLFLSSNNISGSLPVSLGRLKKLKWLDISNNSISGPLPSCLGGLKNLEYIRIQFNSLEGDVSEIHFENLTNLVYFRANGNPLKLTVSSNWIPPLQLQLLDLGSWNIDPQFPPWVRSLKSLTDLDLSDSRISSSVPIWFWKLSANFNFLNLSHNQIHGVLPNTLKTSKSLWINLSSNRFKGPVPQVSSNLLALDISNNSFAGSISNFLCSTMHQQNYLELLNFGNNLLSGEIPNCWMHWKFLVAINLSNNKFNGSIPDSIGTLSLLESLHLRNNSLSGELPLSLKNCTKLVILDIGENQLIGSILRYIAKESLSGMIILNFHSNKFIGPILDELCHANSLHILDLGNNHFSRTIPKCISNFSAMARMNESVGTLRVRVSTALPSDETALLQMKGKMLEYSTNVGFVRSLDLSNNKLSGEIPNEITNLAVLLSLNLSHNLLTGRIPKDIGSMKELESIDLSGNQLSGEIPRSISSLTFLGYLNLSYNRLSGKIPSGTQIQSFDAYDFVGNELCGRPLPRNCSEDDGRPDDWKNSKVGDDDGNGAGMDWFYVVVAFGFGVGFWVVVGPLLFNRRCRVVYFQFLNRLENKIWWGLHSFGMC